MRIFDVIFDLKRRKTIKPLSIFVAAAVFFAVIGMRAPSAAFNDEAATVTGIIKSGEENAVSGIVSYQRYAENYSEISEATSEIVIKAVNYSSLRADPETGEMPVLSVNEYNGVEDCLIWENDTGMVTYIFDADEGLYSFETVYHTVSDPVISTEVEIGVMIDGEYPFSAAQSFPLIRLWKDEWEPSRDENGNDIRPRQTAYDEWLAYSPRNSGDMSNEPYKFYLSEGTHTLTIRGVKLPAVFKSFSFKSYTVPAPYEEARPTDGQLQATPPLTTRNEMGTYTVILQGEKASFKTSSSLLVTGDRKSYLVSPSHPVKQRYNTIGSGTWNRAGQAASWEFSIPNDGYYAVSVRVKQNEKLNSSYRRVYIDGEVPCAEFAAQAFPYKSDWYSKTLTGADNEPIYLHMEAGRHTLTFEAVFGGIPGIADDMRNQPLELDYIEIGTVHEQFIDKKPNFIEQFFFDFSVFVASYFNGYEERANNTGESLDIWVSGNRQAAAVMSELNVIEDVTIKAGDALIPAAMAGHAPDAAVFCESGDAAVLACRNMLVDLSGFDDYSQIYGERLGDSPYYDNFTGAGVFALPVTVNFPLMFYRTDIFSEYNLTPPVTWEEFVALVQVLTELNVRADLEVPNNTFGYSFSAADVYTSMFVQEEELRAAGLTKIANILKNTTELYTAYNVNGNDLFTNFISGETPIVIQDCEFYNTLCVYAPEINGLWDIALTPGTPTEDGEMSHHTVGKATNAVIFNNSFNKSAAWEFIKWFTTAETQAQYGKISHDMFGRTAAFYPSVTGALEWFSQSRIEMNVIMKQKQQAVLLPAVTTD